jgi:hypothetical protein
MKTEVGKRNETSLSADVGQLVSKAVDTLTVEDWKMCVRCVKKCGRDGIVELLVMNLRDGDTASDSDSDN